MPERYFIRLAYDGTRYHGWQFQKNALSVQQEIEDCLAVLLGKPVPVVGCGRTDAGVHAREFFAHFDTAVTFDFSPGQFVFKMNCILPKDIVVYDVFKVNPDTHARFSAVSRTYHYTITTAKNPFILPYSFYCLFKLDMEIMNRGAELLYSYTDFTSFSKIHTDTYTNNCKITQSSWYRQGDELIFRITADRFLRNMVRAIVGTHIDLGRGKINLDEYVFIIESKDRSKAGYSVPAKGLALVKVEYPEGILNGI